MYNRILIKEGRRIKGFVWSDLPNVNDPYNRWHYAFGKPSQAEFIAFDCEGLEDGRNKVNNA